MVGERVFRPSEQPGWWHRLLNRDHLDRAHEFFERYGGKAVVLARFVPIVRTFVPFVAGAGAPTATRRQRLLAAIEARMQSAPPNSILRSLNLSVGQARIHNDPIVRAERAIQQAVSEAMLASLVEREGVESERRRELSRLIAHAEVRAVFHPIVRLADREIIGHEALTRPVGGVSFESVEELRWTGPTSAFAPFAARLDANVTP